MTMLADTHVHLLAGTDDGPRDLDEAVAMCRVLVREGVRHATALAHQNESYPDNAPVRLRRAATELAERLRNEAIGLTLHPTGEVALTPNLIADWRAGQLLSVGDHKRFLLVEMPACGFVNLRPFAFAAREFGLRFIVAHAERYPDLLHDPGATENLLAAGCLIQVTASALAHPPSSEAERALRSWAKRGMIHLLGSDGHRINRRRPHLRAGYEVLARWAGPEAADRTGIWGSAVLQGLPVKVPPPAPRSRSLFSALFG